MRPLCVICFVTNLLSLAFCKNGNAYNFTRKSLPGLSVMENIDECLENPEAVYYSVDIVLQQDDSPLSKFIQNYSLEKTIHYNYSNIHRAICGNRCGLNKTHTIADETVVTTLKKCLNRSLYDEYGLQVDSVSIYYVKTNEKDPVTLLDYFMAAVVIIVVLLNIGVSLYYCIFSMDNVEGKSLLTAFSIQKNWKELSQGGRGENLLTVFEGLRFYTNFIVLVLHSGVFLSYGMIINAEYIEDSFTGVKNAFANVRVVMQVFFVSAGFLMANKILRMIENQTFTLKSLPELVLNRYLRVMPTLLFVAFLIATWIPKMGAGCLWDRVVSDEGQMCKQYWWQLATLTQNYFPFERACLPQTWSLGADWQLYNLSLLILLIVWKWPKHGGKIMFGTLIISLLVTFLQTYFLDLLPIRNAITPETIRNRVKGDPTFFYGYVSAQANWTGYHIGVLTAYIYRKSLTSQWDLRNSKIMKIIYLLSGPVLVASIWVGGDLHHRKASSLEAAVFNTFNQNLFAAAIAVVIFSSLYKVNDLYINILEWGPLQSLGRLSFCSSLVHTVLLRTYGGHQMGLYATDYNFVMLFAGVFLLTYVLSVPLYIFLEAPACALQKMLLNPKRKEKDEQSTNASSNGVGTIRFDGKQNGCGQKKYV